MPSHIIIPLIILIWVLIEWIKLKNHQKKMENQKKELLPIIKRDLLNLGVSKDTIKKLTYDEGEYLLQKVREEMEIKKKKQKLESEEKVKKIMSEIENQNKKRPTLLEKTIEYPEAISKNDVDYLEVEINGFAQCMRLSYVSLESFNSVTPNQDNFFKYIDELEVKSEKDETITEYLEIYDFEFGTKNHFVKDDNGVPIDFKHNMSDLIKKALDLTGEENGYVIIQIDDIRHSCSYGMKGLDYEIKKPLTRENIEFYNSFFRIESKIFKYDDFEDDWLKMGDEEKYIAPVSKLDDRDSWL